MFIGDDTEACVVGYSETLPTIPLSHLMDLEVEAYSVPRGRSWMLQLWAKQRSTFWTASWLFTRL